MIVEAKARDIRACERFRLIGRFAGHRWTVRYILTGIVFVLVLPELVFCSLLMEEFARSERAQSRAETLATAIRTADALDRELGNLSAAMRVLSTSGALRSRDIKAFDEQARVVAQAIGQNVVLSDTTGQQLVNTRLPLGAELPRLNATEAFRRMLATGGSTVSDLSVGAVAQRPIMSLFVPVLRDGRVAYALSVSLEPLHVSGILQQQALPPGWIASVVDGNGLVIARTHEAARFVGQRATEDFQDNAIGDRAVWTGTTLGGDAVLAGMARLRMADWRVGAAVPLSLADQPLYRSLTAMAVGGSLTLALAGWRPGVSPGPWKHRCSGWRWRARRSGPAGPRRGSSPGSPRWTRSRWRWCRRARICEAGRTP